MQYDAMIRTNAINCMRVLCKMSPVVAGQAEKFIAELESASICRAPLAILIGKHLPIYHHLFITTIYYHLQI
uniref:GonkaIs1 n=2 Tax=Unclassified Bacteria TaxID=49928 RepID=Q6XZN6_UNCXX|nr:gonkaIs1 [endosymbiont of Bombyx mori (Gonka stock)]AAP41744.1 sanishIs1 [endosymbiont of Bombyx mori (Sanish stock)]